MRRLDKAEHRDRLLKALGKSPLFQSLKKEHLSKVESFAALVRYEPRETVVKEGDGSDSFLVLLEGDASVQVTQAATGEATTVAKLGPLDIVGELGLILSQPRSASVVADTPVMALSFDAKSFNEMFRKVPSFGMEVCRFLAKRVTQTSQSLPIPQHKGTRAEPAEEVVSKIPLPFLRRHQVLPLDIQDGVLIMGFVLDPTTRVLEAIRQYLPALKVQPVRITAAQLEKSLQSREAAEPVAKTGGTGAGSSSPGDLTPLLNRMIEEGASDLHLSAGQVPRWRVDGELRQVQGVGVLGQDDTLEMLRPIMTKAQVGEYDDLAEVDFAHGLPGVSRFRVNLFRDTRGACAVLRQIPEQVMSLDSLGLPPVVRSLCNNARGLILVTGPTGSGKSTTLASMVDKLNHERKSHILTLEDPVEFVHESDGCLVNQREVGSHTRSFHEALRAGLREDPDIVLVGEMRDLETIALALETANTGHLVFGTLHTSTAISTVDRMVNLFPADQQEQIRATMADVLKGVISQVLCRRVGGGRVAAVEILVINPAVSNLIREGKTHQIASMMATGQAIGNRFLNQSLQDLVQSKVVEPDEAFSQAVDKADLARRLGTGIPSDDVEK